MSFKTRFYGAVAEWLRSEHGYIVDTITEVFEDRYEHTCCSAADIETKIFYTFNDEDGFNRGRYVYLGTLSDLMEEL